MRQGNERQGNGNCVCAFGMRWSREDLTVDCEVVIKPSVTRRSGHIPPLRLCVKNSWVVGAIRVEPFGKFEPPHVPPPQQLPWGTGGCYISLRLRVSSLREFSSCQFMVLGDYVTQ